jgi:peptidoglycan/LPS O-acetylase OafA/YrhL
MAPFEESQALPSYRMPDQADVAAVEALRGLAALMVLVSHYVVFVREGAGPWGLAATGVDLFFVLSGFVFARALGQGHLAWLPHLLRRFFRLYPLYLLALLLYAVLRPEEGRWSAWWSHVFMLHTTGDLALATAYNVAFWSLPPEVEFYLVLPLLVALLGAASQRTATGLWWLLGAALAVKLALVSMAQPGEVPDTLRGVLTVHLPGLLVEFLLGSAAAVATGHVQSPHLGTPWPQRARTIASGAGLGLMVLLWWVYRSELATPQAAAQASLWLTGNFGLLMALAFALLLLSLNPVRPSAADRRTAASSREYAGWTTAALWAGRLSYGLYLFHNAAPILARRWWPELSGWPLVMTSLVLTLITAWALHLAVEAPCRRLGRSLASALQRRA